MKIPLYQVDAFSRNVFQGNPAAVCVCEAPLDERTMQAIAAENNLSETAFISPSTVPGIDYSIRWFTPTIEVELCGHATLASAWVVFNRLPRSQRAAADVVRFVARSQEVLAASQRHSEIVLDLPADPPERVSAPVGLTESLGAKASEVVRGAYWMAVFEDEETVRDLRPDFNGLGRLGRPMIATASGHDVDFVSRFFAPSMGINEDPVTGSAHCMLVPYWASRLGRTTLLARQLSSRGGELTCYDSGDRTHLAGAAAIYFEGVIHL